MLRARAARDKIGIAPMPSGTVATILLSISCTFECIVNAFFCCLDMYKTCKSRFTLSRKLIFFRSGFRGRPPVGLNGGKGKINFGTFVRKREIFRDMPFLYERYAFSLQEICLFSERDMPFL